MWVLAGFRGPPALRLRHTDSSASEGGCGAVLCVNSAQELDLAFHNLAYHKSIDVMGAQQSRSEVKGRWRRVGPRPKKCSSMLY